MRAVVHTATGVVELNYSWLPTWIGMNTMIKRELDKKLSSSIEGMEISERTLDRMHEMIIDELCKLNPTVDGLREYLDGLKYVKYTRDDAPNSR